jgi:hypothetical protein
MFTFRISQNTTIQALEGAGSHQISQLLSTKRVSSFAGDLNTFYSGAKSFSSFAQAYAGGSLSSPPFFAAR